MKKNVLLEGSVAKALLRLAIPIVLINLLQSTYQLTDTFWVGRVGPIAVAAVSLSFPIIFLLISMGAGFAISGTVLVSQYTGQNNPRRVDLACGQTFIIMTVFSLLLSVIGYFFSPLVVRLMTQDLALIKEATNYLQISFLGLFFTYTYIMFQSLFRGAGNIKAPLIIVLTTVSLNFILDPILIMGWGGFPALGVLGAAYATVITQAIAAVLGITLMVRGRSGIQLSLTNIKPVKAEIIKIIRLGLPASAEQSSRALSMLMIMFIVAGFGVAGTAAYGVGARVLSFVIIPALGFSMATSTVVGQNIGATLYERARQTAYSGCIIIFLSLTTVGFFLLIFAHLLMQTFVPNSPEVQNEGARFIQTIALTFGLIGIQQVISGALRGGGSTLVSMILAVTSLWVFRLPMAYLLSHNTSFGIAGVWWAFCCSNILGASMALIVLFKSNWQKKLTEEPDLEPLERKTLEETMIGDNLPD